MEETMKTKKSDAKKVMISKNVSPGKAARLAKKHKK